MALSTGYATRVSLIDGSERIVTLDIDQGRSPQVEESADRDLPVDMPEDSGSPVAPATRSRT